MAKRRSFAKLHGRRPGRGARWRARRSSPRRWSTGRGGMMPQRPPHRDRRSPVGRARRRASRSVRTPSSRPRSQLGDGCRGRPVLPLRGADRDRRAQPLREPLLGRRAAAGPQVQGRARPDSRSATTTSFREFVTLHRGTAGGGGVTRIGSHGLYMAYAHIAHDCQVGRPRDLRQQRRPWPGTSRSATTRPIGAFSRRAPVLPRRRVRLPRRLHDRHQGLPAVHEDGRAAGRRAASARTPSASSARGSPRNVATPSRSVALPPQPQADHHRGVDANRERSWRGQPDVDAVLEFIDGSQRGVILARG